MRKEKYKQSQKDYDRENTTSYSLKLNNKTDADIIKQLSEVPAKQTYIKLLIRADIAKGDKGILFDPLRDIERTDNNGEKQ